MQRLLLFALCLISSTTVFAQTGTLYGTLQSETSEPLAGATVILRSATGTEVTTETSETGQYKFTSVPAGTYTVVADHPAHHPDSLVPATVRADGRTRWDAQLLAKAGAQSAQIAALAPPAGLQLFDGVLPRGDSADPIGASNRAGLAGENNFVSPFVHARSAFPLVVERARYDAAMRRLRKGSVPEPGLVRVEEFVNAAPYRLRPPAPGQPVVVSAEYSVCPWNPAHLLLLVAVKTADLDSAMIARREKPTAIEAANIQLQFNPGRVQEFRLLGYENRETPTDSVLLPRVAASLPRGWSTVALYEIVPTTQAQRIAGKYDPMKIGGRSMVGNVSISEAIAVMTLVYRMPGSSTGSKVEVAVKDSPNPELIKTSNNFRFAAGAALFAMLVGESRHAGTGSFALAAELAESALGSDPGGRREAMATAMRALPQKLAARR